MTRDVTFADVLRCWVYPANSTYHHPHSPPYFITVHIIFHFQTNNGRMCFSGAANASYCVSSIFYLYPRLSPISLFALTQDILEKIRECGSSVTYYGGRVLNNHHSTGVSPIAKAIMREIHNGDTICGVCQPHNCPHRNKLFTSFCETDSNNSHLGNAFLSIYNHTSSHSSSCQIQLKSRLFCKMAVIYSTNHRLFFGTDTLARVTMILQIEYFVRNSNRMFVRDHSHKIDGKSRHALGKLLVL